VAGVVEVFLLMTGLVDVDRERERLEKELGRLEKAIESCRAKLNNEGFLQRAPAEVIEQQRALLAEHGAKADRLRRRLAALG
jgi:valyl-tRNA synthetase